MPPAFSTLTTAPHQPVSTSSTTRPDSASRRGRSTFVVNPATTAEMIAVADAGEVMPQKSTFFFPKLTSGLLFHPV